MLFVIVYSITKPSCDMVKSTSSEPRTTVAHVKRNSREREKFVMGEKSMYMFDSSDTEKFQTERKKSNKPNRN